MARDARSPTGSRAPLAGPAATALDADVSTRCRTTRCVVSWKREVRRRSSEIFDGRAFAPVLRAHATTIHKRVLRGRVFVALHMHAGDGNVHTNIPVNSDDYAMLQEANAAVARIMALARALGGVISGEHGIGITKLEFLTDEELEPFARLQAAKVDPQGRFNKRQAAARGARSAQRLHAELLADRAESLILEQSRDRRDRRLDQGLPALRQVQAGVRDARAARQPAVLAAQQDPRDVAADRGVPVRGADAPRHVACGISTSSATSPTTAPSATSA